MLSEESCRQRTLSACERNEQVHAGTAQSQRLQQELSSPLTSKVQLTFAQDFAAVSHTVLHRLEKAVPEETDEDTFLGDCSATRLQNTSRSSAQYL